MSQRGNDDSRASPDLQAIVVDEMECGESEDANAQTGGYQVENFKYHVFSTTTSSIPPLSSLNNKTASGSGSFANRMKWNGPRMFARRLIDQIKRRQLKTAAASRLKHCGAWQLCISGLGAILLLLFLILVGIQWNQLYHERWLREHQCLNSQCLSAAAQVHGRLNRSMNPCDNFYQYACGLHFTAHHPEVAPDSPTAQSNQAYGQAYGPSIEQDTVMQLNQERGRQLLRIHRPAVDHLTQMNIHSIISGLKNVYRSTPYGRQSAKYKIAQWFRSCSSRTIRSWFGNREFFQRAVPALGGVWLLNPDFTNETSAGSTNNTQTWPSMLFWSRTITSQMSLSVNWSWFDAVKRLHTEFHVPVFMDFRLSQKRSKRPTIVIVPDPNARSGSYFGSQTIKYMTQLIQTVCNEAGIPYGDSEATNRTKLVVKDAMFIMGHLNKIFAESRTKRQRVPLGQLNEKGTTFGWVDILNDYFNQTDNRISDRTEIETNYLSYLQKLSPLIDTLQRNFTRPVFNRMMNNYLVWSLIESYAWHLSFEFASLHHQRQGQEDSDLEMDCFVYTHEIFSTVLGAIYVEQHLNDDAVNHTKSILKYIKPSAKKQLDSLVWMDAETKENIHKRIDDMKFISEVPEIMRNDVRLDYAFRDIRMTYVYVNNLLGVIQYMRGVYNRVLAGIADPHENDWIRNNINVYDSKIGINVQQDELYVPLGALQPPVYHHSLPATLNFAGIGSMVGSALAQLLGESGAYKYEEQITVLWTQPSWEKYVQHWDCMHEKLKNTTQKYFNITDNLMSYLSESIFTGTDEVIDEASGLSMAKMALDSWFLNEQSSVENTLLPGKHIAKDELFYIAYAQTFCEKTRESENWWRMIFSDDSVPRELLINHILSEEPDFAKTFQCPVGSPMRPATLCSVVI